MKGKPLAVPSAEGPATAGRRGLPTVELEITARLAEAFPGDPCRGDFALYGLGIDEEP